MPKHPVENLFWRYKRYSTSCYEKIYGSDQGTWITTKFKDYEDEKGDSFIEDEAYNNIVERVRQYWEKGHKFDIQWMIDYLCEQHLDNITGRNWCHHCAGEDEEKDKLFPCCRCGDRYTHHKYNCSRAGNIGDTRKEANRSRNAVPAVLEIEKLWCCWGCMFEKDYEAAWKDEINLSKEMRKYWTAANERKRASSKSTKSHDALDRMQLRGQSGVGSKMNVPKAALSRQVLASNHEAHEHQMQQLRRKLGV